MSDYILDDRDCTAFFWIPVTKHVSFRGHVKRGKGGHMYNDEEYTNYRNELINGFLGRKREVDIVNTIANAEDCYKVNITFYYPATSKQKKKLPIYYKGKRWKSKDIEHIKGIKYSGRGSMYKKTTPDLDNLVKAVKDAMQGIIYQNDARIVELSASKKYDYADIETDGKYHAVMVEIKNLDMEYRERRDNGIIFYGEEGYGNRKND